MQIWKRAAGSFATGACFLLFTASAPRIHAQAQPSASHQSKDVPVPVYKVDPFWPKPLPHQWILQGIPVMVTDKDDHIWVVSRPKDANPDETGAATNPPRTGCCIPAPAILEFDTAGNLLKAWGGHGMPLSEISNDPVPFYDWKSGAMPPDLKEFVPALHCVHIAPDGLVYVCERGSDRIQVFTKQGKFVTSFFVHPTTPSRGMECGGPGSTVYGMCGTTYNLTFSHDPDGKYVFIADGTNDKIWIHDRKNGELKGSIGDNGRMAGYFHWIDAIAMDSKGNLYTGEVETGKRIQKFILTNGDGKSRLHPHE